MSRNSNTTLLAELRVILQDGPVLQWRVKQLLSNKGFNVSDLETGKKLMNLKLERKRNGFYLRLPNPGDSEV